MKKINRIIVLLLLGSYIYSVKPSNKPDATTSKLTHTSTLRPSTVSPITGATLGVVGATLGGVLIGGYHLIKYLFGERNNRVAMQPAVRVPIVGGKIYNSTICAGLDSFIHPFDSMKYGKVEKYLKKYFKKRNRNVQFYTPTEVSQDDLALVHTQAYIDLINTNKQAISEIVEVSPLAIAPRFLIEKILLRPMRLATGGTIQAARLALAHGWAINLGGGYHHAKSQELERGGYCIYADIPIAVRKLWQEVDQNLNVLIIDLDAHQGNGHEAVLGDDERVAIFDMYNGDTYPQDEDAKSQITFDFPIRQGTEDQAYLDLLETELPAALDQLEKEKRKPDLIIYNAGTDILQGDPEGQLSISMAGIIQRDEIVFRQAKNRQIPILYLFSGGYTKSSLLNRRTGSAYVISKSLKNILDNIIEVGETPAGQIPSLFEG